MRPLKKTSLLFPLLLFCVLLLVASPSGATESNALTMPSLLNYQTQTADSGNSSLKLTISSTSSSIDTSELMKLFDLQEQSLENLENQWNLMLLQLGRLESNNKELELQLSNSSKIITSLQESLTAIRTENEQQKEYQKELESQIKKAERKQKLISVIGPIAGLVVGSGITALICILATRPISQ